MSQEINRTDASTETEFHQAEPAELDESSLQQVAGGAIPETKWTVCNLGGPSQCQKY